ncbi:hypothetical protein GCM10010267_40580 [Streptomyces griseorubens]|nr:hypothetical protein GCM10010267_40580 [Streptomyces griseorubens]
MPPSTATCSTTSTCGPTSVGKASARSFSTKSGRHSPEGLVLHVFQQNIGARAFYERHGFTVLDTSDGSRNMENLPDMTLRWTPSSAR